MRIRISLLLLVAATLHIAVSTSNAQPTAPLPTVGTYTLQESDVPYIPGSSTFKTGGLSGLFHSGGNEFWAITDRGPNVDFDGDIRFLVPSFRPRIFKIRLNDDGTMTIVDSITITRIGGGPTSGLPNPGPYNTGETAYGPEYEVLGTDDWGFDTEGILCAPDGTLWMCDEYAPGIAQLNRNGEIINRYRPLAGLPDVLINRRPNRGFEGIAMTPNGKIYSVVQSGMANAYRNECDCADDDTDCLDECEEGYQDDRTDASEKTELLRLVELDPTTGETRMFAYLMEDGYPRSGSDIIRKRDIKIGDLAALNDNELLIIEHAQRGTENVKSIYKISLAGATPITHEVFEVSEGKFKALEELNRDEVSTIAGLIPVSKSLVLNLLNPGNGNPVWPTTLDKPEGLAIINSTTIAVGNDNDFGLLSPEEDGQYIFTGSLSNIYIYRLDEPLNYQLGPHASFHQGSVPLVSGSELYNETYSCVGEEVVPLPVTVRNTGTKGDLVLYSLDIFKVDSTFQQGTPDFSLVYDAFGNPVPTEDYVVTTATGSAPITKNTPAQFPVVLAPGEAKTFYINFVSQRSGKRYARLYLRTNSVGIFGQNYEGPTGEPSEGLMVLDLTGRGKGGVISTDNLVFPPTKPGASRQQTLIIRNDGECTLRLNHDRLRINAGDVTEFDLVQLLANTIVDPITGDFIIPPGGSDSIVVQFTPNRSGSRRATISILTNDSSRIIPGVTERGSFYVDLYGTGTSGLEARDVTLPPAVAGGASQGIVVVENNSLQEAVITGVTFRNNPGNMFKSVNWPALPIILKPGAAILLGISFQPPTGTATGQRQAFLDVSTSSGGVVTATIRAEAGTRMLTVAPASLFGTTSIPVGQITRRTLAVANTGTLPIRISAVQLGGTNPTDYSVQSLQRLTLEPGQVEFLEVTYQPQVQGASSATITVKSNASNGDQVVMLGGTATSIKLPDGDTGNGTSAVTGAKAAGLALNASVPNPARETVTLSYTLASQADIRLALYDTQGKLVAVVDEGTRQTGAHTVQVNVRTLPAGTYHYTLQAGGATHTRALVVVK